MDSVTTESIKRLMMRNYRRFSRGQISESQAYKENAILANILKAIEVSETEERLRSLEETLRMNRTGSTRTKSTNNNREQWQRPQAINYRRS